MLLDCKRFDSSVLLARQIAVQPGQEIKELLDRPEGARFVNFAAGYFNLQKRKVADSFMIPFSQERRGDMLLQLPQKLFIELRLGPEEIEQPQQKPETAPAKEKS